MLKAALRLLLTCCALLQSPVHAQTSDSEEEKSWAEAEIKLPPYPKPQNLIQFHPVVKSGNRYYIDPESISVGGDGVVRYTLVMKSGGGAENVSYEGIRCRTLEHKYYAFGQRDGSWANARSSDWRRIGNEPANLRRVLYWDYFCPDRLQWGNSPKDAINRFRNGIPFREPAGGRD